MASVAEIQDLDLDLRLLWLSVLGSLDIRLSHLRNDSKCATGQNRSLRNIGEVGTSNFEGEPIYQASKSHLKTSDLPMPCQLALNSRCSEYP